MFILDLLTIIIVCIKVVFLGLILLDLYLSTKSKTYLKHEKARSELKAIYTILMGIFLVISFNPFVNVILSKTHSHLIFIFAIISIFETVPELKF